MKAQKPFQTTKDKTTVGRIVVYAILFAIQLSSAQAATIQSANAVSDISINGRRTFVFRVAGLAAGTCESADQRVYEGTTVDTTDTSQTTGGLIFSVTPTETLASINGGTAPTNSDDLSIRIEETASHSDVIPLLHRGYNYTSGSAYHVEYGISAVARTFAISLADIAVPATTGYCNQYGSNICTPEGGQSIVAKTFNIGIVKGTGNFSDADADVSEDFDIVLAACPSGSASALPFTTPSLSFGLINGDERVKVANNTPEPSADSKVPLRKVVVFANSSSSVNINAPIKREFSGVGGGVYDIGGLVNDTNYCFALGYVNAAGLVTTDTNWSTSFPSASIQCATPSKVDGFLDRSTCFIASAAYGDEWDPRLESLRQFRDQILSQTSFGKMFIDWYYSWSPRAAHWLFEHPGYRIAIRAVLMPVVELSRIALWLKQNMWAMGVAMILGTAGVLAVRLRTEGEA